MRPAEPTAASKLPVSAQAAECRTPAEESRTPAKCRTRPPANGPRRRAVRPRRPPGPGTSQAGPRPPAPHLAPRPPLGRARPSRRGKRSSCPDTSPSVRSLAGTARTPGGAERSVRTLVGRFDRRGTEPFELFRSEFGQNSCKIQKCSPENSKNSGNFKCIF